MAQNVYLLSLHVAESKLGAVISALQGEATIVAVAPTKASGEPVARLPRQPMQATPSGTAQHYAGGKRNKGISGKELAMQILGSQPRPFAMSEIVAGFKERGFAETSAYPVTYDLVKAGKVRALGEGRYALPNTPLKMSDLVVAAHGSTVE